MFKNNFNLFYRLILIIVFSILNFTSLVYAISFSELFQNEIASNNRVFLERTKSAFKTRHFVIVDGIFNEITQISGNYFYEFINELKFNNISYTHLRYSSADSIVINGIRLSVELGEIYQKEKKPIILIGHSMGGSEALYSILIDPGLMTEYWVDKVVLIQAAIGGSNVADNIHRCYFNKFFKLMFSNGLESLKSSSAAAYFNEVYQQFLDYLQLRSELDPAFDFLENFDNISSRVFYIRSSYPNTRKFSLGIRLVHALCGNLFESGDLKDGMLNLNDQRLDFFPPFGVDLGPIEADHFELVISSFLSNGSRATRHAFARAVLKTVFDELISSSP